MNSPTEDPRAVMLRALDEDASWCDDWGDATLDETARRTVAIALDALSAAGFVVVAATGLQHGDRLEATLTWSSNPADDHPVWRRVGPS